MGATLPSSLWLGAFATADLSQWASLFAHFLVLSFLAIGGAITVAPEMHRVLVDQRGWLSDGAFAGSIALAQAAPGPNVLYVAVVGFQVAGLVGAIVAMLGMLLPSTLMAVAAGRAGSRHGDRPSVRALVAGLAPVTLGLIAASSWILIEPWIRPQPQPLPLLLVLGSLALAWRTKISPVWLIAAGAAVGAGSSGLGWI